MWTQTAKLIAADAAEGDWFGFSVDVSGDTAIIGAILDDVDHTSRPGSAYIFEKIGGVWTETAKLQSEDSGRGDGTQNDLFAISVGVSGNNVIIGAQANGQDKFVSGDAYIFHKTCGVWREQVRISPYNSNSNDLFATSVSLSGETAIIGAQIDDHGNGFNYDAGAAYIFDLNCSSGTPARLTDFTVLDGELISGGLPEIASSDDMYLETEARVTGEVAQPHLMRVRIVAESDVQDPTEMVLTFESHITDVEGTVWLFLRNWRRGELVQVCQFALGMEDEVQQVAIPRARRFIRASDGRIKLQIKKIVFFPFTLGGFHSLIDHVEIAVQ